MGGYEEPRMMLYITYKLTRLKWETTRPFVVLRGERLFSYEARSTRVFRKSSQPISRGGPRDTDGLQPRIMPNSMISTDWKRTDFMLVAWSFDVVAPLSILDIIVVLVLCASCCRCVDANTTVWGFWVVGPVVIQKSTGKFVIHRSLSPIVSP